MEKWYLLYCKRGQIERAMEHLNRQNVVCMTPMTEWLEEKERLCKKLCFQITYL